MERREQDSITLDMRYNWETPFLISSFNPRVFYMAGNRVLKSMDRGDDLYPISPDLTTMDTAKIHVGLETTGGITNDATGAENYCTIVSLAESYLKPGWLYAGTDDGNVWLTHNDGATWEKLNGRFPGVPAGTYVSRIEPSYADANTFYVAFDNHRNNDFTSYLYETNDGGTTFRSIASDLPTGGPDFVHVIREDPYNKDLLFVGTSRAAYVSTDGGGHWSRFMSGMPTVPVYDLKIHPRDHDLIAATFGRGIWIADVAPLEQLDADALADDVHLFQPVTAYQYGQGPAMDASANGMAQGEYEAPSPAYGARISYKLANKVDGQVTLTISGVAGDTIATLHGPGSAGLHTVTWNFQSSVQPPRAALSPSEVRDSIQQRRRSLHVIDSLATAGMDTLVIKQLRDAVESGNTAALFGRGGRGGGGGARGGSGGFVERPAEGPLPGAGNRGGASTNVADAFPGGFREMRELFGLGRGGGGFGGGANRSVSAGEYLVTLTVGDDTQTQVLRVEQYGAVAPSDGGFGVEGDREPIKR